MHRVLAILALASCTDDGGAGASVDVDGVALELPSASAAKLDTILELTATASDGTKLELSFPAASATGEHRCDEGRAPGIVSLSFTRPDQTRFSSVYPQARPAHTCAFVIDQLGAEVGVSGLGATLWNADGTAMVQLAGGSFHAAVD